MGSDLYETLPLEDLVTIHDKDRKPVTKSDRKAGPYPYYGASGITDYVENYIFDGDYVLLAEDGDNLRTRNTPIAFMARGKFWVNNHAHIVKAKGDESSDYICYALQVADVTSYISGSTRPKITQADMKKIPVSAPPKDVRNSIAHILSSLDNKIQLNRETNQTLEAMAQALFKSWFVDFDPVFDNIIAHNLAHNNAPLHNIPEPLLPHAQRRLNAHNVGRGSARQTAAHAFHHLFPQAFEQSDEPSVGIQGWVPQGWGVEKIGDVIENVGGGTPKTKEDDYWINGTHSFCTPKDMSSLATKVLLKTERHLTDLGVSKVSSGVLDVGTVLMSSRAPIGYLAIAKTPTTVNQGIIAMKPNEKYSSEYILCWAEVNQEEVVARANGSTFLEISKKNFREIPFVEPTDECTKQFGILAKEYFDRIEILSKENKQLESLRDTLLPKLISGELRIPDAQQSVEVLVK